MRPTLLWDRSESVPGGGSSPWDFVIFTDYFDYWWVLPWTTRPARMCAWRLPA